MTYRYLSLSPVTAQPKHPTPSTPLSGRIPHSAEIVVVHRIVTDYAMTKGSAPVWVESMMSEFATSHTTDGMDKVTMVKVFKPVLVRIVHVRMMIEFMG